MADHVVVVRRFAHLVPLILLVAKRNHRLVQRLELFIFLGNLGKQLVGCLERSIENVGRERSKLRARGYKPLNSLRVARVILGGEISPGLRCRTRHHLLVTLRQRFPFGGVDEQEAVGTSFPPAWIVVIGRDFEKTELLIIIGADPFGSVDRTLLERRIDVAWRYLLRHDAEPAQHLARNATDAEFEASHIFKRLDFFAKPAAHLCRRIAKRNAVNVVGPVQLIEQVEPAAIGKPRVHLPRVKPERDRRPECKCLILADVVIGRAVSHFDGMVGDRIKHLEWWHDFAGAEHTHLKFLIREFTNNFAEHLAGAIERIKAFRERSGEPPSQGRSGLCYSWCADCARCGGKACGFKKLSAVHNHLLLNSAESLSPYPRIRSGALAAITFTS